MAAKNTRITQQKAKRINLMRKDKPNPITRDIRKTIIKNQSNYFKKKYAYAISF